MVPLIQYFALTSIVILRHSRREPPPWHLGDVAHLAGNLPAMKLTLSVRSFQVPGHAGDLCLAAKFAFGSDFACHAVFAGEGR